MVNDKNAWQYSGLVSLRTTLLSQCCTALCSGKTCLEANLDKCIKSNNNIYTIALQTLSGRLFCVVVGHLVPFLLFTRWPEATFFPLVLKLRNTFRHIQCLTTQKDPHKWNMRLHLCVRAHTHTHWNRNILHIPYWVKSPSQKTGGKRVFF